MLCHIRLGARVEKHGGVTANTFCLLLSIKSLSIKSLWINSLPVKFFPLYLHFLLKHGLQGNEALK